MFQKSVYTFFEALAVCHTVQVAGSYEEDEDRAEEELNLLSHNAEIPPIFHKSLEELNDIESVHEEIDFITSRQTVTFDQRNGNSRFDDLRPSSEMVPPKERRESSHKRPLSLSNIQIPKGTILGPTSPIKHVEFVKDNMLLRKVQQQEYKRANSQNAPTTTDRSIFDPNTTKHRRTQSSIPFGSSSKKLNYCAISSILINCHFSCTGGSWRCFKTISLSTCIVGSDINS